MDKKLNKIHENVIPKRYPQPHCTIQILQHNKTQTYFISNWPAFLAANDGSKSLYALIRIIMILRATQQSTYTIF